MDKDRRNLKRLTIFIAIFCVSLTVLIMIMTILVMLSVDDVVKEYEKKMKKFTGSEDICLSNPCFNGATWTRTSQGQHCACVPGFTGTRCDIDIDDCASSPCKNGAVCTSTINNYTCACVGGYSGRNCSKYLTAPRLSVLIQSNGTKDCLRSAHTTYLMTSPYCNDTSFSWNYTNEGLLQGQKTLKCLGFVVQTPSTSSILKHISCNSTDPRQMWTCVGNDVKLKHYDFFLQAHSTFSPPYLSENPNIYTKWQNPVTSKTICE